MADILMCGAYPLDEVVSALQKTIRRGDEVHAMYWARVMIENGFAAYMWRRLAVTAGEDCAGEPDVLPYVASCHYLSNVAMKDAPKSAETNIVACAILKMCRAVKSHEACDLDWIVAQVAEKGWKPAIPSFAVDMHTKRGKELGFVGQKGARKFCEEGGLLDKERPNRYAEKVLELVGYSPEEAKTLLDKRNIVNADK
jgi:replication-associated recombination protein RarA